MQRSRYPVSGVETRHSTCWTGHFADETRATAGRIVAATAAMRAADRETRDATGGMSCFRSRDTTLNLLDGTFHGRNTSNSRRNRRCNRRNACCRPRNKRCNGRDVLFQESRHDSQPAGQDISWTEHEQQPAESLLQPPQPVLPTAKQEIQTARCVTQAAKQDIQPVKQKIQVPKHATRPLDEHDPAPWVGNLTPKRCLCLGVVSSSATVHPQNGTWGWDHPNPPTKLIALPML
jgi:hypothetical protein